MSESGTADGWEYTSADTQYHVHGIHPYPARMIPQIAHRLIKERSGVGEIVLDPFCGSGSVLVEALLLGRNAIGVDINPLAHLITKVKTTPLDPAELDIAGLGLLEKIRNKIDLRMKGTYRARSPYFENIRHWFTSSVIEDLALIKEQIELLYPPNSVSPLGDFFKVCFSMTVRKTSNIDFEDNPYFIRAIAEEDLKNRSHDVFTTYEDQVNSAAKRIMEFSSLCPKNVKASVFLSDSRELPLQDNSVNLIVTSPPYGEESHTMSYSRFSKLSLLWMGMPASDVRRYTRKTLGGDITIPRPNIELLNKTIEAISNKNRTRAKEAFSFFWDYAKCLKQMFRVMINGGYCCIVIGDRTVAGITVSNEDLTKEFGRQIGFEHITTYHRDIPKKVLPRKDYKVELINKESIIVMKKP